MPKKIIEITNNKKKVIVVLIIILALFGADVIVESYMNYEEKFGVTEDQSKVCFV
jgi:hypothetical protein